MAHLKEFYKSDVAPAMMSKFGYKSVMLKGKIILRSVAEISFFENKRRILG